MSNDIYIYIERNDFFLAYEAPSKSIFYEWL